MPLRRLLPLFCAALLGAQEASPVATPGTWTGTVRFYNVKFQEQYGGVPVRLDIAPDLTLTGTVGGATIQPAKGEPRRKVLEYRARLTGEIRPEKAFRKRRLVLLITRIEGDTLHADVHLKHNFVFDIAMRNGDLVARKQPGH